ncbi:MAG: family 10 glycosylhydrolase [Lentisphaerae bacterium]|nr:family 10 glycosylhydrolase [Lentisphaerota bacterium]
MDSFTAPSSLRRAACFLLCLGVCLTFARPAAGDRQSDLNLFVFRNSTEAQQAWKAGNGAPAVIYEPQTPAGVRFTLGLATPADRVYWDRGVSLDLRGFDTLALDLTCSRPTAIRVFGLYLKSGEGWYLWRTALKESGRQRLSFALKDAATEGQVSGWDQISAIRISLNRELETSGATGAAPPASIVAHGLRAHVCDLVIVQGTLSITDAGERAFARSMALRVSHWLQDQGIIHSLTDDEAVIAGRLKSAKLAILPYNSWPPANELRALASFVRRGGKLMVCYSAESELAELMGLKLGRYQKAKFTGQWSSFAFNRSAPPNVPAVVYQESLNILPAYPADKDSQVIAFWQNDAGNDLSDPAWVQSPKGLWMSHVLLDGDIANKQRMLLALLGAYLPELWEQAAARASARAGKVGPFASLAEASAGITAMARGTPAAKSVDGLLAECHQDNKIMSAALAKRKYPEVVETARRLQTTLAESFARVQRPKSPEFRGVWDHTGLGLYPGNWSKTTRILAEAGLNAIFVNVLWPGRAHYDSKVVSPSEAAGRYGDQLKQCLDAARGPGLEVHVWKICWNLSNASDSFVAELRKAGRLQVAATGEELKWLCPTHPDNVALELKAISEVITRYAVDGIHLDYVRYPDANTCFCAGCRRRFEQELGEKIRGWPTRAASGELRERYKAWRSEQMTAFVRAVHELARAAKAKPIKVSAAVYPEYPGCISSLGQDWGRWLKEELVDFVCPMDYAVNNGVFQNLVRRQLALPRANARVYPGLGVTAQESQLTPDQVIEQILALRAAGAGGFVLFDLNRTLEKDVLSVLRLGITRTDR